MGAKDMRKRGGSTGRPDQTTSLHRVGCQMPGVALSRPRLKYPSPPPRMDYTS